MLDALQTAITILASVAASSGFWAYLTNRSGRTNSSAEMLKGLAHDRIVFLGMRYIHRGWISKDEYDDLNTRLYLPYKKLNGNGLVDRVMLQVNDLPLTPPINEEL